MTTSRKSTTSIAALLFATTIALLTLSACNTIEGVGQDVGSVGGAVEDAADDNKKD